MRMTSECLILDFNPNGERLQCGSTAELTAMSLISLAQTEDRTPRKACNSAVVGILVICPPALILNLYMPLTVQSVRIYDVGSST